LQFGTWAHIGGAFGVEIDGVAMIAHEPVCVSDQLRRAPHHVHLLVRLGRRLCRVVLRRAHIVNHRLTRLNHPSDFCPCTQWSERTYRLRCFQCSCTHIFVRTSSTRTRYENRFTCFRPLRQNPRCSGDARRTQPPGILVVALTSSVCHALCASRSVFQNRGAGHSARHLGRVNTHLGRVNTHTWVGLTHTWVGLTHTLGRVNTHTW
jgi:hypothetical protein